MSAKTLFDSSDFKVDAAMLAQLAELCSPDLPHAMTTTIGDFAFNEICVSTPEADYHKDILLTLRDDAHANYIDGVITAMKAAAAEKKCKIMANLAAAVDAEYTRFCNVFFLRTRQFEVTRISSEQVIGRIISFPDQISDDYGNNLEPREERLMNPGKAGRGERAVGLKTVYLGYGQGSAMAQILACLYDAQALVFDGTLCSELLVKSLFDSQLPDYIKMMGRKEEQEDEHDWHIASISVEMVGKRFAAAIPAAMEIAIKLGEERKEAEKKAAEEKKAEAQKPVSPSKAAKKNAAPEGPSEEAAAYLAKRVGFNITGLVPEAVATRFNQSGKFSTTSFSNLMTELNTMVRPAQYPYPYPAAENKSE